MFKLTLIRLDLEFPYAKYLRYFPEEIVSQINSFYFYKDRVTSFASALAKYYLLPKLLKIPLTNVRIKFTKYGKPYLENDENIHFNISHSEEYLVIAIAGDNIGIDLERINDNISIDDFSSVFNEEELNLITTKKDFFWLWTKKEAYLKHNGCGFIFGGNNCGTSLNLEDSQVINRCQILTFPILNSCYLLSIAI